MLKSKLIQLFSTLHKTEVNEFGRYIQCSFFNKDEKTIRLFKILKKEYPNFTSENIAKETLFAKLYPTAKHYDAKKMNAFTSKFSAHVKDYLTLKGLRNNKWSERLILLETLENRRLRNEYFTTIARMRSQLNPPKSVALGMDYFHKSMLLVKNEHYFPDWGLSPQEDQLNATLDYFDKYTLIAQLRHFVELLCRGQFFTPNFSEIRLQRLLTQTKYPPYNTLPLFIAYELAVELLLRKEEKTYEQLSIYLKEHRHFIQKEEQIQLLQVLINYTIGATRNGKEAYAEKRLSLYTWGLEKGILLENDYLPPLHFINCIDTACGLKKHEQAEQIIKKYEHHLDDEVRENTVTLAKSNITFSKGKYGQTTQLLQYVVFKNIGYLVVSKTRLLQSYYELIQAGDKSYEDTLQDLLATYIKQLKGKKKVANALSQSNLNFVYFLKKLINQKTSKSKEDFLEYLEQLKPIAYKPWLKSKVEDKFQ